MECVSCGQDRPIAARGLCRACYSRWQRNGSVAFVRPLKDAFCTVDGCGQRAHGQGLCTKHLQRLRRTGTTAEGRAYKMNKKPEEMRSQHDLYPLWREFSRDKNLREVVPEWKEDMARFVADVGGHRPGRRFRIYPIDRSKPMGPGNYEWREALVAKEPGEDTRAYNKRQQKAHRAAYPSMYKDRALRRAYGDDFGFEAYAKLADAQNNRCAICNNVETARDKNGNVKDLTTEHDHETKGIRSLTCQACNLVVGFAAEDIRILEAAILYLIRNNTKPKNSRFIAPTTSAQGTDK